jgi:hypothetical protein
MREKKAKIVFYGALWGSIEASLGYLLHLFFVPFTGFLMFPIGAYFMRRGSVETDDRRSAFYIALVAALIKCVDFLVPGIPHIKVINPVIGILLQGIAVSLVLGLSSKNLFAKALSISFLWRCGFIAILLMESLSGAPMRLLESGLMGISRYLLLDSLVNGVLIYGMVKGFVVKPIRVKPSFATFSLLVALSINYIL